MQTDKVVLYTQAYNAESTLQRTINSVLAQTYKDWIWFIVDNGSLDGTGQLIMNAAIQDTRIIPVGLENNDSGVCLKFWPLLKRIMPDGYLMHLDADDVILPDCLDTLLSFIEQNHVDIAACGTEFVAESDLGKEQILRIRKLDTDLILEGKDFADYFYMYKPYVNEFWAKLYCFSIINEESFYFHSQYPHDSLITLDMFRNSNRVGICSRILHRAYIGDHSLTRKHEGVYSESVNTLLLEAFKKYRKRYPLNTGENINKGFLEYKAHIEHYGELTTENREYLYSVYIGWIHMSLVRTYLMDPPQINKLYQLILSDEFKEVFSYRAVYDHYHNMEIRSSILKQIYYYAGIIEVFNFAGSHKQAIQENILILLNNLHEYNV